MTVPSPHSERLTPSPPSRTTAPTASKGRCAEPQQGVLEFNFSDYSSWLPMAHYLPPRRPSPDKTLTTIRTKPPPLCGGSNSGHSSPFLCAQGLGFARRRVCRSVCSGWRRRAASWRPAQPTGTFVLVSSISIMMLPRRRASLSDPSTSGCGPRSTGSVESTPRCSQCLMAWRFHDDPRSGSKLSRAPKSLCVV